MSLAILFRFLCAQHVSDIKKRNKIASDIKLVFYSSTISFCSVFILTGTGSLGFLRAGRGGLKTQHWGLGN